MRLQRSILPVTFLLMIFAGGCSDNKTVTPVTDSSFASKIVSTTPFDGCSQVDVSTPIIVRFSSPQDTASYGLCNFAISSHTEFTMSKFADSAIIFPVSQWDENSEIILFICSGEVNGGTEGQDAVYVRGEKLSVFHTKINHPLIASITPVNYMNYELPPSYFMVEFTEDMNLETLNNSTFYMEGLAGTIEKQSRSAKFIPEDSFEFSYRGIIKGIIETAEGTPLGRDIEINIFRLKIAYTLSNCYVYPSSNAKNVPVNSDVEIQLYHNEPRVDASNLHAYLSGNGRQIPCAMTSFGDKIVFAPSEQLAPNTEYEIFVSGYIEDYRYHWPYSMNLNWSFTTAPAEK